MSEGNGPCAMGALIRARWIERLKRSWSSVKSSSRSASLSKLITMARSSLRMTRARKRLMPHPARRAACTFAAAGIDQHAQRHRQGRVPREGDNLLVLAVFADLEVVLLQVRNDPLGLFVAHRHEKVHQIDLHADGLLGLLRQLVAGRVLSRRRGLRGLATRRPQACQGRHANN